MQTIPQLVEYRLIGLANVRRSSNECVKRSVDLVDRFPVLKAVYGYTRGGLQPGFPPDSLQDDRVPSTAETHLHGRCPIGNADEYAGDP